MPRSSPPTNDRKSNSRKPQAIPADTVEPIWLVKAIALTILAALICGYLTFCLLFYQGQWQLVLHPMRTASAPDSIAGAPYDLVHFGPDETATPQLTGWWIPASSGARYAHATLLFLPSSDGSLRDDLDTLNTLHNLGINIFAFDYRGYGQSAAVHPSEQRMTADADAAWQYLTTSRSLAERQLIPYGVGVGASLAAHLAFAHSAIPALILDSPRADLLAAALRDPRSRLLPVHLLFQERFPLARPLSSLRTPKLLISDNFTQDREPIQAFKAAADPKITVEFATRSPLLYRQALTRFLDQYLPPIPPPQLVPSAAPSSTNSH